MCFSDLGSAGNLLPWFLGFAVVGAGALSTQLIKGVRNVVPKTPLSRVTFMGSWNLPGDHGALAFSFLSSPFNFSYMGHMGTWEGESNSF